MKTIVTPTLIFLLGLLNQAFSQTILFQDDFESYAIGTFPSENWILRYAGTGTVNQVIVDDEWTSPDHSLRLECAPNWAATADHVLAQTTPIIYGEGNMMIKVLGHGADISFKNPDIGPWGTYYARVRFSEEGKITFNEEIELQDCEINVWYHIKMMYDSQNDLCNVWIDDVLRGTNLPCPSNGEYTAFCIQAGHPFSTSQAWFDDVIVYTDLLPPVISSIIDVPNDQGKHVMITWERSNLDIPDILSPISHYTIWRYDEILTFITQVPAMQLDQYSVIATTLYDSCELGCNYSKFQVVAHTADISVYFTSEVDSGYSVNNTGAPFAIDDSPEEIAVWQIYPNPAEDVVSVSLGSGQYAVGSWQLAVGQKINLMICDLCGRELWRFLDEVKSRGEYSKSINVSDMPAGVYLVRVQAGEHSAVRKIVVR